MKPQTCLILFSLSILALALIPLTAAQDGNALTDAFSGFTEWISGVPSQISSFATEQPVATGVIGTTVSTTGILGYAYKAASKAKSALTGQVSSLTNSVSQQAEDAKTKLENTIGGYEDKLKTVTAESQQKIEGLQKELEAKAASATEFKNLQDQNQQLQELVNNNAQTLASNTKVLMDPVSKKYYQASVVKEITVP